MPPIKQRVNRLLAFALVAGIVTAGAAALSTAASTQEAWGPKWTADGKLQLPGNFRQWVFLGSPLTPHALNDGKAGFPEYHNVYVRPEALALYRETGEWPEGTIMLKELQLTIPGTYPDGSRDQSSGRGFFPGALNGIDISVKDSSRFKDTNGWGFFNFGHHAPPYAETATVQPAENCAACHEANADNMVFSKFYAPLLNAR